MGTADKDEAGLDSFDTMIDFDSLDGGNKPLTLKNLTSATLDNALNVNTDTILKSVQKNLPEDARTSLKFMEDIYSHTTDRLDKELDNTGQKLNNVLKQLKSALPKEGMVSSIFDNTLGKFISDSSSNYEKRESEEERKKNEIASQIDAAIGMQTKSQEIQNNISNFLQEKRTRTTNELLKHVVANTTALREVALTSTVNYQRKHLELQFRQTYILKDMLSIQAQTFKRYDTHFQALIQNTSLPDVAKLRQYQTLSGKLMDKGREFVSKKLFEENDLVKNIKKNIDAKISAIFNTANDWIDKAENMIDAGEQFASFADGQDMNDIAGSFAAEAGQGFFLDKIFKRALDNKLIRKGSRFLRDITQNPQDILRSVNSSIESNNVFAKGFKFLLNQGIDLTKSNFVADYGDVKRDNLDQAAIFDGRMKATINNVIPGYLRLIHSEVRAHRLNMSDSDVSGLEVSYDYNKDDFVKTGSIGKNFLEEAKNRLLQETESSRREVKDLFKGFVDKGAKDFTEEELDSISKAALTASLRNHLTGRPLYTSKEFQESLYKMGYDKNFVEKVLRSNELRDQAVDSGKDKWLKNREISSTYSLRNSMPSMSAEIKDMVKSGNIRELAKIGLAVYNDKTRDYRLDINAVNKLIYGGLDSDIVRDSRSMEAYQQERESIMAIDDKKTRKELLQDLDNRYKDYQIKDSDKDRMVSFSKSDFSYSNLKRDTIEAGKYLSKQYRDNVLPHLRENELFNKLESGYNHVRNMDKQDWVNLGRSANNYVRNFDREEAKRLYALGKDKLKEGYTYAKDKINEKYGDQINEFMKSEFMDDMRKVGNKIEQSAVFQQVKEKAITYGLKLKELPNKIKETEQYKKVHEFVSKNFQKASDFTEEKLNEFYSSAIYRRLEEKVEEFKQSDAGKKLIKFGNDLRNIQQIATDKIDKGLDYVESNTWEDFKGDVSSLSKEKLEQFKTFISDKYGAVRDKINGGKEEGGIDMLMEEADIESLASTHAENLLKAAENGLEESFNTINSGVPDIVRVHRIYQEAYNKGLSILENSRNMQDMANKMVESSLKGPDTEEKKQGLFSLLGGLASKAFNRIPGSGMIKTMAKIMWAVWKTGNAIERKILKFAFKNTIGLPFRLIWSAGKKLTRREREKLVEKIPDSEMPPEEKQKFIEEGGDKARDKQAEKLENEMSEHDLYKQQVGSKQAKLLAEKKKGVFERIRSTFFKGKKQAAITIDPVTEKISVEEVKDNKQEDLVKSLAKKGINFAMLGYNKAKDLGRGILNKSKEELQKVKETAVEAKQKVQDKISEIRGKTRYSNRIKDREEKIRNENRAEGFLSRVKKKFINGREVTDKKDGDKKEGNWAWLKWFGMAALGLLGKAFKWIKNLSGKLWNGVKLITKTIGGAISWLWGHIGKAFNFLKRAFVGVGKFLLGGILKGLNWVGGALTGAFDKIKSFLGFGGGDKGKNKANNANNNKKPEKKGMFDSLVDWAEDKVNKVKEGVKYVGQKIGDGIKWVGGAIKDATGKLMKFLPLGLIEDAAKKVGPIITKIRKGVGSLLRAFLKGLVKALKVSVKVLLKIIAKVLLRVGVYASTLAGNLLGLGMLLWDLGWIGYYILWQNKSIMGSIIYQVVGFDIKGEFAEDGQDAHAIDEDAAKKAKELETGKDPEAEQGLAFEKQAGDDPEKFLENGYLELDDNDKLVYVQTGLTDADKEEISKSMDNLAGEERNKGDIKNADQYDSNELANEETAREYGGNIEAELAADMQQKQAEDGLNTPTDRVTTTSDSLDIDEIMKNTAGLEGIDSIGDNEYADVNAKFSSDGVSGGGNYGSSSYGGSTSQNINVTATADPAQTKALSDLSQISREGNKMTVDQNAKLDTMVSLLASINESLSKQQVLMSSMPGTQGRPPLNVSGNM